MVNLTTSLMPRDTSPSTVYEADSLEMGSLLASAEIAPATVYMVRMVLSSKNARSRMASSEGRRSSVRRSVSFVNGPSRKESSCTAPFTGRPGLEWSIRSLNFSGEAKRILQVQPSQPSVMRQPSRVKWKVQQGPPFTSRQSDTGFFSPARISFALPSSAQRSSSVPSTPYIFT